MKNKKLLFILIPAVAIIWGLVIWNIIKGLQSPEISDPVAHLAAPVHFQDSNKVVKKLQLDYSDPFLKRNYIVKTVPETKNIDKQINKRFSERVKKQEPKRKVVWPEVKYYGLIEGNNTIGLFELEDKKTLLKKGDISNKITIEKIFNDSAIIVLDDEKKTIYK